MKRYPLVLLVLSFSLSSLAHATANEPNLVCMPADIRTKPAPEVPLIIIREPSSPQPVMSIVTIDMTRGQPARFLGAIEYDSVERDQDWLGRTRYRVTSDEGTIMTLKLAAGSGDRKAKLTGYRPLPIKLICGVDTGPQD